ncbi:hypothetical protein ABZ215_24660 [Amycolatopsis sp. NPDC006131]|uniref:hypothetical protein n=1 Tax=Amycolatopsis sp. NPDC006131 TaxID=3156731 RepID=UPI0033B22350
MKSTRVWPLVAQYSGAAMALAGLYGLIGLLWTALIAGVAMLAIGTVAELKGGA